MQIIQLHKERLYPYSPNQTSGYSLRKNNPTEFVIVVHSTNGKLQSSFEAETNFLFRSKDVSSHYLISKDGRIVSFFEDPIRYAAWHAGAVIDDKYNNNSTIAVETHYTPGENKYNPRMHAALIDLLQYLYTRYTIKDIVTHRQIAVFIDGPNKGKLGRKVDPSQYTDLEFESLKTQVIDDKTHILGHNNISIDILRDRLLRKGVFLYEIDPIVCGYTSFGEITRMGNVYPLAQAAHETGWFKSERWTRYRNPAGLGATNDGALGSTFSSITGGILGQYAHLLCYATRPEENTFILERIAQLSPRKDEMRAKWGRGSAKSWEDLNGKWAWPGTRYAQEIIEIAKYFTM